MTLHGEYVSRVPTQSEAVTAVHRSLAALPRGRWVLAVSGGRDSMVLLDAMAHARAHEIAAIATFDHGTGAAARRAVRLVEHTGLALQLPVVTGLASSVAADEASWREARWHFLNSWAEELRATVVTAHTWDDQVETVVLRILRDAGARGLAGMRGATAPTRPLLEATRAEVAAYAKARKLRWVEDPSNQSRAHARNRVRLDLLPALERAAPGFSDWCWSLSGRAASLRAELAAFVDAVLLPERAGAHSLVLDARRVRSLGAAEWRVLWPELASRAGVTMDRRGIERASAWAPRAQPGSEIQLAGGGSIARTGRTFVVRQLY